MIGRGPRSDSDALHVRARAMVRAFEGGMPMPESFDALAVDLARFQARTVPGYSRLCAARGVDPARMVCAGDAPAVPSDAFKLARVFAFGEADAAVTFRTSGTSLGARGVHFMRDVGTYDAAALAFGRAMLAGGLTAPVPVIVIGPSAEEAPDSSLAHMCTVFVSALAPDVAHQTYFVRGGSLDIDGLRARVAGLAHPGPALILATSFALVHALDALGGQRLAMPAGSRVMQTGGFKGKSREVVPGDLRRDVARAFGVPERAVIGEYGMTELSSQFWEATLIDDGARHGVYRAPPWARVVAVDPETLASLPQGMVGIARIEDLANVDSAFAVLTQDRVRSLDGGFELLGRAEGAPPRGCSLALDEMLSSAEGHT
ncbi:MAG TPA: acyl-protein synthetase [Polyangiaceae bacterium]